MLRLVRSIKLCRRLGAGRATWLLLPVSGAADARRCAMRLTLCSCSSSGMYWITGSDGDRARSTPSSSSVRAPRARSSAIFWSPPVSLNEPRLIPCDVWRMRLLLTVLGPMNIDSSSRDACESFTTASRPRGKAGRGRPALLVRWSRGSVSKRLARRVGTSRNEKELLRGCPLRDRENRTDPLSVSFCVGVRLWLVCVGCGGCFRLCVRTCLSTCVCMCVCVCVCVCVCPHARV